MASITFKFGETVVVEVDGEQKKGQVMGVRDDGTFDILFDDQTGEPAVAADRIRPAGAVAEAAAVAGDENGGSAAVESSSGSGGAAELRADQAGRGGTAAGQEAKGAQTPVDQESDPPPEGYKIGGTVEMRDHKTKQWIPATIKSYNNDLGAFDVLVNGTGVVESGVPLGLLRHVSEDGSSARKRSKSSSTEKAKRRANKRKRKLLAAINDVLSGLNEAELQASLQMIEALSTVCASRVAVDGQ